jgi:NADH:ubiquinone oxidoreductase subunit 6 (subunit J)
MAEVLYSYYGSGPFFVDEATFVDGVAIFVYSGAVLVGGVSQEKRMYLCSM